MVLIASHFHNDQVFNPLISPPLSDNFNRNAIYALYSKNFDFDLAHDQFQVKNEKARYPKWTYKLWNENTYRRIIQTGSVSIEHTDNF